MNAHATQEGYQVRLDWGPAGAARLAPSDVLVLADAFDLADGSAQGAVVRAMPGARFVHLPGLARAEHVAADILALQRERGARTSIAIIALDRDLDGVERFLVEGLFAAGALVAALGDLGIDHTSPDAAAASEAYRAVKGGMTHLLSASSTGRALRARGEDARIVAALRHGSSAEAAR